MAFNVLEAGNDMFAEISLDLARLKNVKQLGDGAVRAACPACQAQGSDASGDHLFIKADGKYGCATHPGDHEHRKEIYKLAGKQALPMQPRPTMTTVPLAKLDIDCTYDYHNSDGAVIYQVVRCKNPKDFRFRRPDGKGDWIWNINGVEKTLFHLPQIILEIAAGKLIFLCEGEKDVLAMVEHEYVATCNPGGAVKKADGEKWLNSYTETLRGADLCIIADKDAIGRKHAEIVADKLYGIAKSVRVIELPDVNGKPVKDPHDFFSAGGEPKKVLEIAQTTPTWMPPVEHPVSLPPQVKAESTSEAEVRGEIVRILLSPKLTHTEQRTQVAVVVVQALAERGRFFFHAERKNFDSAMYFDNDRKQLLRIRSDAFCAWLADWIAINRADAVFKFVISAVETEALAGLQTTGILPESFWASRPGAIYLSNGDGSIAKIMAGKVELVDNGADGILFAAGNTLTHWTLTAPQSPFETCTMFSKANCAARHGLDILQLWILSLPTNPASKPPICFAGEIGSGKTRIAKGIAELFGLPFVANKVEDFGEDSFWASLDGGGLFTLDNCDTRNKWLPDAVASAATDGCSDRRKLYTDSERVTLRARAWLALTTSNPTFASDSGLADRLILIRMNRRMDETSDARLTEEIRKHRNASLSYIAETLATALADTKTTPAGLNQRHPDFAEFAVRLGRAIGRENESIIALKAAEQDKSLFCLENDPIGAALSAYLKIANTFTGTAAELLPKLIEFDGELAGQCSAKSIGKRLAAIWPHLQSALAVAKRKSNRNGVWEFEFKSAGFAGFQTTICQNS